MENLIAKKIRLDSCTASSKISNHQRDLLGKLRLSVFDGMVMPTSYNYYYNIIYTNGPLLNGKQDRLYGSHIWRLSDGKRGAKACHIAQTLTTDGNNTELGSHNEGITCKAFLHSPARARLPASETSPSI